MLLVSEDRETVFVGGNATIHALDMASGETKWLKGFKGIGGSPITLLQHPDFEDSIFAAGNGRVKCFDFEGNKIWSTTVNSRASLQPDSVVTMVFTHDHGHLGLICASRGIVTRLRPETGVQEWTHVAKVWTSLLSFEETLGPEPS